MLYVFGLSAWWWIVLLLVFVWWGYRRLDGQRADDRRPLYIALAGFLVLIVASSGLETLRFYTLKATLPVGPGGVIGIELAAFVVRYLGYTGATLALFALLMLGWSIFSGMSWITAAERASAHCSNAIVSASTASSNAGRTDASAAKSRASEKPWSRARRSAERCA
jgi:S-DNA-T family DNA segregation ATPase FtsK/SpoIIIE